MCSSAPTDHVLPLTSTTLWLQPVLLSHCLWGQTFRFDYHDAVIAAKLYFPVTFRWEILLLIQFQTTKKTIFHFHLYETLLSNVDLCVAEIHGSIYTLKTKTSTKNLRIIVGLFLLVLIHRLTGGYWYWTRKRLHLKLLMRAQYPIKQGKMRINCLYRSPLKSFWFSIIFTQGADEQKMVQLIKYMYRPLPLREIFCVNDLRYCAYGVYLVSLYGECMMCTLWVSTRSTFSFVLV